MPSAPPDQHTGSQRRWVMTGYHPGSLEYAFAGFLDAHPFVRILICGLAVGALVFSMLTARDW